MADYRAYFFNEGGHIQTVRDLASPNDAEVLREVARFRHPHPIEVWDRGRLVARLENLAKHPETAPLAGAGSSDDESDGQVSCQSA